jgi:nucleotide-binding universal stress UspA family protein
MNQITSPRIVAGLDDSDQAPAVAEVAESLAARLDLPLDIVHSPSSDVFMVGELRRETLERGVETMAALVDDRRVRDVLVQLGPPAELLRAELDEDAVLGVVGARGRGPWRSALLGSVSDELARTSPRPLVIVPPQTLMPDCDDEPSIVCRLDGSPDDAHTLRAAVWIAAGLGGRLSAVNVRALPAISVVTTVERVERELVDTHSRPAIRVETGDPIDQLTEVVDMHDATLIVVGSRGETLRPSSLATLVAGARRPVMAVSPQAVVPGRLSARVAHAR